MNNDVGGLFVQSRRAGGAYRLTGTVRSVPTMITTDVRSRLTTWMVDQRRLGNTAPIVDSNAIGRAKATRPLRVSEKIDRVFLALASQNYAPGQNFKISGTTDDDYWRWIYLFAAWTESDQPRPNFDLLQLLIDYEYIANPSYPRLTAKGFERLELLTSGASSSDQGFVAMWFSDEMTEMYNRGFEPAIVDAGYRPRRIDRVEHINKIDDEIIAEIRRSRFIVADMTCGVETTKDDRVVALQRGGVYYEAGFAQGLGIPVIWTARHDAIDNIHFDTRQYAHIVWKNAEDLRASLKVRIGAVLGYGPLAI